MSAPTLSANAQKVQICLTSTPQYYALMNLALASLAYVDEFGPNAYLPPHDTLVVGDLQTAIGGLPPVPMPAGSAPASLAGSWSVLWGPAYPIPDYSNLMYVATYNDPNSTPPNAPVFAVVSIRGTDTNLGDDVSGLLNQIVQDMEADTLVSWSKVLTGSCERALPEVKEAKIASGTCKGLQKLLGLSAVSPAPGAGTTIEQCLEQLLTDNPGLPLIVTGHSLGACLSTVMAAYLQNALSIPKAQVVPTPFAPPTAGNGLFATTVLDTFPLMNAWANVLDLVPMAYANLPQMDALWQAYQFSDPVEQGPSRPPDTNTAYDAIKLIASHAYHYTQPTTGFVWLEPSTLTLPSKTNMQAFLAAMHSGAPWDSWLGQLMWQHFPPAYWQLISQRYPAPQVAPYPYPTVPQNTSPRLAGQG